MNENSAYMIPMPQNCGHENNFDTVEKLAAPASGVSQSEPYRKRWSASI